MKDEFFQILDRIKSLSSRDEDFKALLDQMHKLAAMAPLSIGTVCSQGTTFYRGTNHHSKMPSRIEEIWYPPADCVRSFGRANRPGSPMFYCCSDPNGAFTEARINCGQYAVLATWVSLKSMTLHDVGYSADVLKRAGASRPLPERHAAFHRLNLNSVARDVRDFLMLAFTVPMPDHYRVTAAIAEMFLACHDVAGIVYPSIAKSGNVDNIALRAEFVASGLKLTEASVLLPDHFTPDAIKGTVVARLKCARDGNLAWEYTGSGATDIPAHSSVAMQINPGERKRVVTAGRVLIDGSTYDLLSGYSIELLDREIVVRDLKGSVIPALS